MHKNPRKTFIEWRLRGEKIFFDFLQFSSLATPAASPASATASLPHHSSLLTLPFSLLTLPSKDMRIMRVRHARQCFQFSVFKYFPLSIRLRIPIYRGIFM